MLERGESPQGVIEVAFDSVNNWKQIAVTRTIDAIGAELVHQSTQVDHSRERKHGARILLSRHDCLLIGCRRLRAGDGPAAR